MKAAVLHSLHQPLRLEANVRWAGVSRGKVLVKLACSGVCHSQLMEIHGKRGPDRFLPHLLGHEGSGIVQEIGEEVTRIRPGDRVVLSWIRGSGIESGGTEYSSSDGTKINAGGITTFNEYALVSENRCTRLPQGVPMQIGALLGCAVPTGAGIVVNTLKPEPGKTLAIFGLGGVGLSALIATKTFELSKVFAIDVEPRKLAAARDLGATHPINASQEDPVQAILRETGGTGVDYSIDAAGLSRTIEQAFTVVRKGGGRCVFASHPASGEKISLDPYDLICGKRIEGSWGGAWDPDRDIPKFASLYLEGKLPLEKLISKTYSLDQINEALRDLETRNVVRPLIVIDPSIE